MAKINLLPWRQELRKRRQQEFLAINMTVAIIALILVVFFHLMMAAQLSDQAERKSFVKSEIDILDGQIKEIDDLQKRKEDLLARMKVIQDLQGRRPIIVRVFDELVRATPDKLYLQSFSRIGDGFKITGVADSNNQVSMFLRNLNASPLFQNPVLETVKAEDAKEATGKTASGVKVDRQLQKNHFAMTVQLEDADSALAYAKDAKDAKAGDASKKGAAK